jgi:hypothetical protein
MNDDSQMLLAVYEGVMDGTCTLAQAMEIVAILGGATTSSSVTLQPAPTSNIDQSNLLDFLDPSPQSNVWGSSEQQSNPPLSAFRETVAPLSVIATKIPLPSTLLDPFGGDPDPFGPDITSIDDLLSSPPIESFPGGAVNSLLSIAAKPIDPASAVAANTVVKPAIDLNALFGSSSSSGAYPYGQGGGQGQQQQYQLQPPQQYQQQPYYGSPVSPSSPGQYSYQQQQQQHQMPPQYQHQQNLQYQQNQQYPQQQAYSNEPAPVFHGAPYGSANNSMPPSQVPPMPSSPPPPPPSVAQQQNPFDSF